MKKVEYTCTNCKFKFKKEYKGWYPSTECIKCGGVARYSNLLKGQKELFVKRYKDLVAQGIDKKTGQPFWIDTKGRRVRHDDPSVRYNVVRDPRGWKATGRKVKDESYGQGGRW